MISTNMFLEVDVRPDDHALLRRYTTQRDEQAFHLLVDRHIDFVFSVCRREGLDAELAKDVTQEVLLCMAQSGKSVRADINLSSWLFAVAVNKCRETRRKEARRRALEKKAIRPEYMEEPGNIDWVIAGLPEPDRTVLILRYVLEQSNREVAEALGTTEDAVRMRTNRAMERLRSRLGYAAIIPALQIEPRALDFQIPHNRKGRNSNGTVAGIGIGILSTFVVTGSIIRYELRHSESAGFSADSTSGHYEAIRGQAIVGKANLLPISGHVQILAGGKVAFDGDTWRTKDVIRWRSDMRQQRIEVEIKGNMLRSVTNPGMIQDANVAAVIIGPKTYRVIETDLFEAALVTLPVYIHHRPGVETPEVGGVEGKTKTITASEGRKYQVWFDQVHDGRISKVDYTFGNFRFVTTVDTWQTLSNGAFLAKELTVQSWFNGQKSETRQVKISDVRLGDKVEVPELPKPRKKSRVMDLNRSTTYLIDENWRRITEETKVSNGDIRGGGQ